MIERINRKGSIGIGIHIFRLIPFRNVFQAFFHDREEIIRESHLPDVADPLSGHVEHLLNVAQGVFGIGDQIGAFGVDRVPFSREKVIQELQRPFGVGGLLIHRDPVRRGKISDPAVIARGGEDEFIINLAAVIFLDFVD